MSSGVRAYNLYWYIDSQIPVPRTRTGTQQWRTSALPDSNIRVSKQKLVYWYCSPTVWHGSFVEALIGRNENNANLIWHQIFFLQKIQKSDLYCHIFNIISSSILRWCTKDKILMKKIPLNILYNILNIQRKMHVLECCYFYCCTFIYCYILSKYYIHTLRSFGHIFTIFV